MKMTFRWYGSKSDPIPLKYVKQIPGMSGLMGLLDKPAGVVWEEDEIKALVDEVHACGLELEVIESVNVHEDIKMGCFWKAPSLAKHHGHVHIVFLPGVEYSLTQLCKYSARLLNS